MAHTSAGVISGSVAQLADVKAVLGESVNTLSGLCKSSKVNKWSKCKPVVYASYAPDRSGTAWWHGTNRNCSLTINTYTNASGLSSGYTSNYGYVKPSGGSTSPYRLLDFQGYNHKAPTLGMVYMSGEQDDQGRIIYYISGTSLPTIQFSFYEVSSAINIMDLFYKNGGGLFTSSDTNLYCGILVKQGSNNYAVKMNPNALGVNMTAGDLGSGKWNRTIQFTNDEVTVVNTGVEYIVYPFVAPVKTYSQYMRANNYGFRSAPLPVAPIKLISASYASKLHGSFTAQTCKATTNAFQVTFTYSVVNSSSSNVSVSGNATFYVLSQTDIDTSGTSNPDYFQGWRILGTKTFTVSFTATKKATTKRTHKQFVNQDPWVIASADPTAEEKVQFCLVMPSGLGTSYKRDITVT